MGSSGINESTWGLISRVSSRTYRDIKSFKMVFPAIVAISTVVDIFDYLTESDKAKADRLYWSKDARNSRMKSSFPEPLSSEQLAEVAKNLKAKGASGLADGAQM